MNLLYKALFYIKAKNLTKNVLLYLLPETHNNQNQKIKLVKNLDIINNIYHKVNWDNEPPIQKILLLTYLANKNYLHQNYQDTKKITFEIKKTIISTHNTLTDIGKNLLIFNAEMLEIKSLIDQWAMDINEDYNIFYKHFFTLAEKIVKNRELMVSIQDKENKQYILLSNNDISDIALLTEMTNQKISGLIISTEKKELGENLLNKLCYFEEKIKKFKNDTFAFKYNILLEKIKIGCYLQKDIQRNFKLMTEFCYLCLNNHIEDPVYAALESYRKNNNKNNSFKDYLYSFKLEILKSKDKKIILKIEKIENYIANEHERITIKKVKKIEEANVNI